jgi:two-component system, LuxR family, sensor kinase FixL
MCTPNGIADGPLLAWGQMNWVMILFAMTSSACLTLAFIYGFVWSRQPQEWANLLFALAAIGAAATSLSDLAMLEAGSAAQFSAVVRWSHLANWLMLLPLAGFVFLYFRAGRISLLWTVCGLRTVSLFLNFLTGENLNYRHIISLSRVSFFGESVSTVGAGVPNPWMAVGQVSLWALVIFVLDASVTVWRRGQRRLALMVGGSIVFFLLLGAGQAALIVWGRLQWPPTTGLFYLGIVVAMAYELGREALRAAKMERDLRARERELVLAAAAANLGFCSWEFASNEIVASDQWRDLFGFSKSEPLYFDIILQRLHPEDREVTRQLLMQLNQEGHYQGEFRVLLPEGEVRWIASQGRVEYNRQHHPARLRGVSLDITRSKQADAEAQVHRNEVAHLLRVASLGELSAALAHELNQPLAAILSNANAALLFLAHDHYDLEEFRNILRDIVTADERASQIIVRVRGLLKKAAFHPEKLEANDLIKEVLKFMIHDLAAHRIRVSTKLTADLPSICGDRVQLQQVLMNLILNASDAMSLQADDARILTLRSGLADDNCVQISVSDAGGGIAPGSEEKIFEQYHTTKPEGLGLGLSLSRSIMLAHRGRLWAENQASGATFHLTIPAWLDDSR